ncbi:membrane-associated protein TcaA [Staphylococcus hominis]
MNRCPYCGQELNKNNKQCSNCGNLILEEKIKPTISSSQSEQPNLKFKKFIPWVIIIFIIILIIIIFVLLRNFNSPEAQTKILVNAIDNNDAQKVATLMSTKKVPIDDVEASVYIQYIKDEVGMMKFIHDVKQTTDKLNKSNNNDSAYIQNKKGENVLKISKNGTRFLIFNNMSYRAPTKNVIVKPKLDTTYKFKAGGKHRVISAKANKETSIGEYIPGVYTIDTEKDTEYGHFTGQMKFDFRYAKGNTVDVSEDFNEALLKVKLKGKNDLDKNTLNVTINGKEMKYDASKEYGPYPQNKDINVSASGQVKDKTFTSTSKTIKAKDLGNINSAMLDFDEDKISNYISKKTEEESILRHTGLTPISGNYIKTLSLNSY